MWVFHLMAFIPHRKGSLNWPSVYNTHPPTLSLLYLLPSNNTYYINIFSYINFHFLYIEECVLNRIPTKTHFYKCVLGTLVNIISVQLSIGQSAYHLQDLFVNNTSNLPSPRISFLSLKNTTRKVRRQIRIRLRGLLSPVNAVRRGAGTRICKAPNTSNYTGQVLG